MRWAPERSWNIEANDSPDNSASYFLIEQKSLTKDSLVLSDGTAPVYDCSEPVPFSDPIPVVPGETIPHGEPVVTPQNPIPEPLPGGGTGLKYDCLTTPIYTRQSALRLGTAADAGVVLGGGSESIPGRVSLGAEARGLLRQIKHLAEGTRDTDLLTKGALEGHRLDRAAARVTRLEELVVELEDQITLLETTDSDADGIPDVVDEYPEAVTRIEDGDLALTTTPGGSESRCGVTTASVAPAVSLAPAPEGFKVIPGAAAAFSLTGCAPGEAVQVTLEFGTPLPPSAVAYKVDTDWTPIPGAVIRGHFVSYEVVDGGPLDADGVANGTIEDPVAVAVPPPIPVPTAPLWLLGVMAAALGWLGIARTRRSRGSDY